ncbi:MAG: hypothetical protein F6J93_31130 [Oscillatoria sp. SIO1A7]|nr:hypothetical protein [Oscillatoria sp. SIO1A7]
MGIGHGALGIGHWRSEKSKVKSQKLREIAIHLSPCPLVPLSPCPLVSHAQCPMPKIRVWGVGCGVWGKREASVKFSTFPYTLHPTPHTPVIAQFPIPSTSFTRRSKPAFLLLKARLLGAAEPHPRALVQSLSLL